MSDDDNHGPEMLGALIPLALTAGCVMLAFWVADVLRGVPW